MKEMSVKKDIRQRIGAYARLASASTAARLLRENGAYDVVIVDTDGDGVPEELEDAKGVYFIEFTYASGKPLWT